jgi:hypothetical protein
MKQKMEIEFIHLPKIGFATELYRDNKIVITLQNRDKEIAVRLFKKNKGTDIDTETDILLMNKTLSFKLQGENHG